MYLRLFSGRLQDLAFYRLLIIHNMELLKNNALQIYKEPRHAQGSLLRATIQAWVQLEEIELLALTVVRYRSD